MAKSKKKAAAPVDVKLQAQMALYKKMDIDYIIDWCSNNGEIQWLEEELNRKVSCKVYPRDEEGKADRTQKPEIKERPITFIQVKTDFVEKFMPELKPPKKEKEPTMKEKLAAKLAKS